MKIWINILSWLLHHANRNYRNDEFYDIKKLILKKYGKFVAYDVQFIQGKKCWSCYGSGVFIHFSGHRDTCWSCDGSGWYKWPVWNILEKLRFGKYTFHQPWKRVYKKPDLEVTEPIIGFINHSHSDYSIFAYRCLLFLYNRKLYWKEIMMGGYFLTKYWYRPSNWWNTWRWCYRQVDGFFKKLAEPISKIKIEQTDDLPF